MQDRDHLYDRMVNQTGSIRDIWHQAQQLSLEDTLTFFARASAQMSEITSAAIAHGTLARLGEQHSVRVMCLQKVLGDRIMHVELGMPRDADAPMKCDPKERLRCVRPPHHGLSEISA